MISITHNEVAKAIEVSVDIKGADLLIRTLEHLKAQGDHLHLYGTNDDRGLAMWDPYGSRVYGELIINLLPPEAWEETAPRG